MDIIKALPIAFRMIFKDPINFLLAVVPTILALAIYLFAVVAIFKNSDYLGLLFQDYVPEPQTAGWLGKLLTAVLIVFVFILMSWTFVIVVGIIASPFNSMLSSRIEDKLSGIKVETDKKKTLSEIFKSLGSTFKNEFKKLIVIGFLALFAFVLNLFPLFYPVGIFLVATLLAVQFIDYSWSRHDLSFGECVKDSTKNLLPYSVSGFCFLLLVTVPIINAIVPALATSYFTVLWLQRQNKVLSIEVLPKK